MHIISTEQLHHLVDTSDIRSITLLHSETIDAVTYDVWSLEFNNTVSSQLYYIPRST